MKRKILNWILAVCLIVESVILCGFLYTNKTEIKTLEVSDAGLIEIAKEVSKVKFPYTDCEDKEWTVRRYRNGNVVVTCMSGSDLLGGGLPVVSFNKNLGVKSIMLSV